MTASWLFLAGGLLLIRGPRRAGRHGVTSTRAEAGGGPPRPEAHGTRRLPLVGGVSAGVIALLFGRVGVLAALPLAVSVHVLVGRYLRSRPAPGPDARSIAFVLDLLAGVLAAGAPPEQAIAGVAGAVAEHGTPGLRRAVDPVQRVGRLLRLGTDPVDAWSTVEAVPGLTPIAAAGRRCAHSGARLAGALADAAGTFRSDDRQRAIARAGRLGVWTLLPLGCCFLPAFICIGVVPVVIGVAAQVVSVR